MRLWCDAQRRALQVGQLRQEYIQKYINYIISYRIVSYHIVSYRISYHIISYHIISYHTIPYHIISYHIILYIIFNPLNAELNPICHLLALLGAHHILHVRRVRVNTDCFSAATMVTRTPLNIALQIQHMSVCRLCK